MNYLFISISLLLLLFKTTNTYGQNFPSKPIRLIVPFTAGGTVDGVARMLQHSLTDIFSQPVIVDNRPGAGGRIGTDMVAKSAPDGYTVAVVFDNYPIDPIIYKEMPYDAWKDLIPVTLVVRAPLIAVASKLLPADDITSLVKFTKANPSKVTFGTIGVGSSNHLAGELFSQVAGLSMIHVPYKGGSLAQADLYGGNLMLYWATPYFAKTAMPTGKVKLLGQAGQVRSPAFPDIKTLPEQGYPSIEIYGWVGILAPAGTPHTVISRWQLEVAKAAHTKSIAEKLQDQGFEITTSTPQEFGRYLRAENLKWTELIKKAKIPLE